MSTKPIFECLLCCEEKIVMKKISKDTLKKYSDYQFKPFIAQFQSLSNFQITPVVSVETVPRAKVKHWSYLMTRETIEPEQTFHDIEKSILRKERPKIEFEDAVHDIYDPEFSSGSDRDRSSSSGKELIINESSNNIKKKFKGKASVKALKKSLKGFK
jgi:hypothetical protein